VRRYPRSRSRAATASHIVLALRRAATASRSISPRAAMSSRASCAPHCGTLSSLPIAPPASIISPPLQPAAPTRRAQRQQFLARSGDPRRGGDCRLFSLRPISCADLVADLSSPRFSLAPRRCLPLLFCPFTRLGLRERGPRAFTVHTTSPVSLVKMAMDTYYPPLKKPTGTDLGLVRVDMDLILNSWIKN
jgi:hypothetical protein